VCDLGRSTVEYIADDRKQACLDTYYQSLTSKQLAGIEAVAMDMWDPFVASTAAHVPDGESKIVFAGSTSCSTYSKRWTRYASGNTAC